jgi:AP-3 complex subunit beta
LSTFFLSSDPASGSIFQNYKKHDDLKQMLDSNKDSLKLEAMKRIIGMIAKGKDASDLFPAVVKNVVSKNIEVKKLVYVFLARYAEEQQDLALLSISTFQRALKDPNQLIRASALRVLSSIRVSLIIPIVMLAIKDSAQDMSPYVRKTAAHAIPKLYNLDPEQKEELITVIEKLLSDKTTLVVGSAVMAFEEVCPERIELIHKNYRKLCNLLVDVDEWGQVLIINMLTRYARTQFADPNLEDEVISDQEDKAFYDGSSDSEKSEKKPTYTLDADHRLLLRQTKPLLQSRNAAVVMAVAQLYHHIAPKNDVNLVAKALIRLLRSRREVQSIVLTCIASMTLNRKAIFELYLKSFFVRTSDDPTHVKLLKLDILTNLATETSIAVILREFQTYVQSNDKEFVAATIQAIGRCASSISEVTETCLSGLVHLLSNHNEYVVAESVVVIKKLLQSKDTHDHKQRIIAQMSKLLDFITVAAARAAILWLIGEYNEHVPRIAPDVLRKMAKSFCDEDTSVKLQVLNLAVKLHLNNPKQTTLLAQHVFNLARYDANYDVRDRARFLKVFIGDGSGLLVG